jgi:hypothetical protein
MGLTDEQVDSIIEMHTETVDGLKDKLKAAEAKAADYDDVVKERDDLKAKSGDDFKKKYEDEHKAFAAYKKDVESKATMEAKQKAVGAYIESKGFIGVNREIAMRALKDEINAAELDGEKLKDTAAIDALIGGALKSLAVTQSKQGVPAANPPKNGGAKPTRDEIMAIKDPGERQRAIAQNLELFGANQNGKD